jgi:hypothetical protein
VTSAHDRLTRYLAATGWLAPEQPGNAGGLWRHPQSDLLLPVPTRLVDGGLDWDRLVERVAQVEDASPVEVVARIDARLVDVANLRAANDIVIRDTIPYHAGVTMVRESYGMLRAVATTSLGPRAHIRGRYRRHADEIAERARMAHTKRGSFIIPIHIPIPEPAPVSDTLPSDEFWVAPESEERRVMRTFAQAIAAVDELAVRPEREPSGDAIHELIRAGVSHEFGAALQRVLAEEAISEFSATFVWAAGVPAPPSAPATVSVPSAAAERVRMVALKLKSEAASRRTEYLTGPIVGVHRDPETQAGTVIVQATRNARLANISVNISPEVVDSALDWMKARETMSIESKVHRTSHGLIADRRDSVTPMRSQQLDPT